MHGLLDLVHVLTAWLRVRDEFCGLHVLTMINAQRKRRKGGLSVNSMILSLVVHVPVVVIF